MPDQRRDDRRRSGDDRARGQRHVIPDQDRGEPGGRQGVGGVNPQHREAFDRRAARHGGQQRYQPGHQRSQGDWQRSPKHQQGRSAQHDPDPQPRREGHGQRTWDRDQQETGRQRFSQHEGPYREHGQQSVQRGRDERDARRERQPGERGGANGSAPGGRRTGDAGTSERARRSRGHPERHYREHLDR